MKCDNCSKDSCQCPSKITKQQRDKIVNIIQKFKFNSKPLDLTIIDLMNLLQFNDSYILKSSKENICKKFADQLLDYKFNKNSHMSVELVAEKLFFWMYKYKDKLTEGYITDNSLGCDDDFWGNMP